MSMLNNQAKEPIVYVRKRKPKGIEEPVSSVVASFAQLEFSSKEIGQTSSKTQRTEPKKLLENKKANTTKKGRTKSCSNSSNLKTRRSGGRGAGNAKVISDNKVDKRKTWKPQTQEETNWNQLALVHDENIDYVASQLDFAKGLGEAAQKLAQTKVCTLKNSLQFPQNNTSRSTYNAKKEGKEIYQERNNTMDFADFYAQRRNKGITICETSVNSRSGEMAKLLRTSNCHSSGLKLQFQDLNQVSLSNSLKEISVWPRLHKPRIIVHPSKIIDPSRFSQYHDQYMQRTSVPAPLNFSLMQLIMGDETLTDKELLYGKELLSTQGLSSGGQRVQQLPGRQVGNYQNMQTASESVTSNFSFMKLLMGDEALIDEELLHGKELLSTQGLSSGGQRVQQLPGRQVGNYQNRQTVPESATSNFSFMKLLMEDGDSSTLVDELYEKEFLSTQCSLSPEGQRVQQRSCSQVGNYQFKNFLQKINLPSYQYQVLQQPKKISYRDFLARDDISYMDLLTREDISWT